MTLKKNKEFNYFLVDLIFLSIKKKYKIKNFLITTRESKHSRIGDNIKIHLKILKNWQNPLLKR